MTNSEAPDRPVDRPASSLDPRYLSANGGFRFDCPEILYGRGSSTRLPEYLAPDALVRPFVLTDRNLDNAKVGAGVVDALASAGDPVLHIREPGEPTATEIDEIAANASTAGVTAIVAIGGGASMDAAKCVRLILEVGGSIRDHAGEAKMEAPSKRPLAAAPTTSGTGSESGLGALYIDDESRDKVPVYAKHMRPDVAVCDPDLTLTVPAGTTAATGADALAQAMGPFTGPLRHPITDALAREAIALILAHLPRAVREGGDIEARVALSQASLMSGLAMNNAEAMADQFFDEIIGPRYGIPHGNVAGVLLPYVMQFNRTDAELQTARVGELISAKPAASTTGQADQAVERVHDLRIEVGIPGLRELGVPEKDLGRLARLTAGHYGVGMGINPRELTEDGAHAILEAAWHERPPLDLEV